MNEDWARVQGRPVAGGTQVELRVVETVAKAPAGRY